MKIRVLKKIIIVRYFNIILVGISVFFVFSCNSSKDEHSDDVLNKRKFISIMIDIHKADALMNKESLFDNKLEYQDSLSYYNQIFKKYNTTREVFYNSVYYYLNDMNKFIEIQKIIVDSLNAKFTYLDSLEKLSLQSNDLWVLKRTWSLPDDGVTNSIPFKVSTNKQGNYRLSAKISSSPDDLSKDLKIVIIATYVDESFNEEELKITTKKEDWRDYSIIVQTNPRKRLKSIEGEVIAHSANTTYMHLRVKDIMLTYEPFEDSTSVDSLENISSE